MKNISVTLSNVKGDLQIIKNELSKGSYRNILFHIYAGIVDAEVLVWMAERIKAEIPEAKIAGTISAGEIKNGRMINPGVLASVMLFEETEIHLLRYDDVIGHEDKIGHRMSKDINAIDKAKAVELILPGTAFKTWKIFQELNQLDEGIQVFGGYAGGHTLDMPEHFVFDENGSYEDSLFALIYSGEDFHVSVEKSVGWQKIGHPFKITKADGNRLIEIDGEPAVEIYEKYLLIPRDSETFAEDTFEFPLMALVNNDELLRHTMAVDSDGSLILAGYVTEGMDISLCFGNPTSIVERINDRLEQIREFRPEAILLYSCSVRKSFWERFIDMEMLPFQKLASTTGFHTWGEVMRNPINHDVMEYNITLLSIAMREGEGQNKVDKKVVVNDYVLKGQAMLMKRLTQLVVATTNELQASYENIRKLNKKLVEANEHDALTGLYNRGKIEQIILSELGKGTVTSVVMLDIDHFKKVNDTYGHAIGDIVLKAVAGLMKKHTAEINGGAAGRWGGEEFFMLLPETAEKESMQFAEKLREAIAEYPFDEVGHVTASMGTLTYRGTISKMELFIRVDDALYEAKSSGRNRVVQAKL